MSRSVVSSSGGASGASPSTGNWASGTFGTGLIRIHGSSQGTYSFTAPSGISAVRVRCWGAGGGGCSTTSNAGGSGGGFSIGEFAVVAGTVYTITVGSGGIANTAGGTSSFGTLISATGGVGANNVSFRAGGVGAGGYANHSGGGVQSQYCGGGGAASLFGHGGAGVANGGTANYGNSYGQPGGGAGGGLGHQATPSSQQIAGNIGGLSGGWIKMTDFDGTTTDGIRTYAKVESLDMLATGVGGVGTPNGAFGSNGGGGGRSGSGGWPGGGGGNGVAGAFGFGADGCVIVEY